MQTLTLLKSYDSIELLFRLLDLLFIIFFKGWFRQVLRPKSQGIINNVNNIKFSPEAPGQRNSVMDRFPAVFCHSAYDQDTFNIVHKKSSLAYIAQIIYQSVL